MVFILCVLTGLRIGEALALEVADVDLVRGLVCVRQTVYEGVVESPKTQAGTRTVPIAEPLAKALKALLAVRPRQLKWLLPSQTGTPLRDRNIFDSPSVACVRPIADPTLFLALATAYLC
jgi:integrase